MMFAVATAAGLRRTGMIAGALMLAAAVLPGARPAAAAEMTREVARLHILDACVYAEWKDEKKRETAATRCGCAAGKLVKSMTDDEFAAYAKAGKLTSVHKEKWDAAMDACD